jgi:hypothetical protein
MHHVFGMGAGGRLASLDSDSRRPCEDIHSLRIGLAPAQVRAYWHVGGIGSLEFCVGRCNGRDEVRVISRENKRRTGGYIPNSYNTEQGIECRDGLEGSNVVGIPWTSTGYCGVIRLAPLTRAGAH